MRLRSILFVLTLLAVVSSTVGGYFSYSKVKLALTNDANQQANYKVAESKRRFTSFLAEQLKPVRTLAGLSEIRQLLRDTTPGNLEEVNTILDLFKVTLGADVCYLLDQTGMTVASSNRLDSDSFVGSSFAFRPYFKQALRGTSAIYMALGITSGKRGVYYSFPVLDRAGQQPLGVAVIKASVGEIESRFRRSVSDNEILLLADPHGIVFISSDKDFLFRSLVKLSEQDRESVEASMQFGAGPWEWIGFTRVPHQNRVVDRASRELLIYEESLESFPGWQIIYLRDMPSALATIIAPFRRGAGPLILPFFLLLSGSVLVLFGRANSEIKRRRKSEQALKESEERYRGLYMHTPALLHSIDPEGRLVSVSDYWSEFLGYAREEVMGRKVTDFMTPESKVLAEQVVIPKFLATGFCKDVAYKFIKKDGQIIDVLLSGIAERDIDGHIRRSIAALVDVTEIKRIEKELKKATEELSRYSENLKRQVAERTREISNILKYTPAIVYLKDTEGRYLLINSRFENLFGLQLEEIRGKSDRDIFDTVTAEQFQHNDQQVLQSRESLQVEEKVRIKDELYVYISVKFPLFDDQNNVIGVGGISTDITDLKKAQDKLRQLSNRILSGQEGERAAIARELHDELGQALTALRLDAVWLEKKLKARNDDVAVRSRAMSDLIDKTIDAVRNMAVRLRPGVLDNLGLIPALEWLVDDFEKRLAVSCTFRHRNVPDLDDMTATTVYRITQEALTNVARHADASHAEVALIADGTEMLLSIKDDGQGFNKDTVDETESLGILGIKERANLIDARVRIQSNPDSGSLIQVQFTLANAATRP
jgi:PAS domain S-box-containing protein